MTVPIARSRPDHALGARAPVALDRQCVGAGRGEALFRSGRALTAGDTDTAEHHARMFRDHTVLRITQMLERADDKDHRRLRGQLGTSRALDDVQALRGILDSG
jgi:hypothetical protein